jgi:flagellin-like protein
MKSISPIIASILIIVITVAIAGIFYAFTSGIFGSLTSSSNNLVNQQTKVISFTINNVYCSNNIIYFDIYNNGNIPIDVNDSIIIFTDNNGNTISINGSNIICNNGNIIPIGSNSLCYVNNYPCYYNYTDYIKSMNFIFNGINYNYDILNNKFNIIYLPNSSSYQVTLYNTQSIPTPSPFQQDIAICNGSINIGNNFAYVNNATLFNQINANGQNVYFATTNNSAPDIYSWYEGQLINGNTYCDVWWVNIPNGIPANSNVTMYMYIGPAIANYYQHYPYVGASSQVISGYDNGQKVFIAYGYFDNTFDGWSGYIYQGSFSPTATSYGIEMLNNQNYEGTYILPPNNGNIPEIPLIVEEAWYYGGGSPKADANVIALFGNTNNQVDVTSIGSTDGGYTPTSSSSTFVQFEYYDGQPYVMLKSAVTNSILNETSFPTSGGTIYSYLIVNSTYAQTGYYMYNSNQVWAPLTLLDTYNINYNNYTYSNLNYNPYQYPTLEIGAGNYVTSYQYVEWVIARAYPPNGIMPSIYIG